MNNIYVVLYYHLTTEQVNQKPALNTPGFRDTDIRVKVFTEYADARLFGQGKHVQLIKNIETRINEH